MTSSTWKVLSLTHLANPVHLSSRPPESNPDLLLTMTRLFA